MSYNYNVVKGGEEIMRSISELGYLFHLLAPSGDGYKIVGKYETYGQALANVTSENQVIRLLDVIPN